MRMLFGADRIPAELRRIVEFLNEQMDPAEVLALELSQFRGEGLERSPHSAGCASKELGLSRQVVARRSCHRDQHHRPGTYGSVVLDKNPSAFSSILNWFHAGGYEPRRHGALT
jgi:hypothetical protein